MLSNSNPQPAEATLVFEMDYSSWTTCLLVIMAGFFAYFGIFVLSHLVSALFSATYSSLSVREKVWWDLAVTRAAFGMQCTYSGLRVLLVDSVFSADKVTAQDDWSWLTILTATGYFLFDNVCLHMYNLIFWTWDFFLAVHHIFSLLGLFSTVVYSTAGHYLVLVTLLAEMGAPFTGTSLILIKAGLSKTLLWKLNQWVIIHVFHCRMVLTYHLWWVCFCNWEHFMNSVPHVYLTIYLISLAILTLLLNPFWTHKKTIQLLTSNFEIPVKKSTLSGNGNTGTDIKKKKNP
ncbi:protein CLN8-like [Discoglossus pictus]